jgi:hypothetical protein
MSQSLFLAGKTAFSRSGAHVSEFQTEMDPPEAYKVSP